MNRLKNLFFLFVLVQGIFYLFLIPPWQSPDETHHFGYGALLSKDIKLRPVAYEDLEKKIIESMDTFNAWKYQLIPRPSPLPHRLDDVPFYRKGGGISDVTDRAPLYYLLSFFAIKELKINGILNQFYLIRSFSLVLFLLSIYFTYLSARILFKNNSLYCLATASFVAFLPQFIIISTSVNPINLAVLIETIFIYLILLSLNNGKKLLVVLFGPIIIGLGFFNHRAALFMVPPFLVLLLIYFLKSLKNKKKLLKISLILLIPILLFLALYLVSLHLFPAVSDSSIRLRIYEINRYIKYLTTTGFKFDVDFFDGFFKSFWYLSGWMRFSYLLNIYSILKLISFLSFLGLLKYLFFILSRKSYKSSIDFISFLIISAACLSILLGTIVKYIPVEVAQGRFIFPAISAFAILFVFGLREICPKRLEKLLPIFIIIGFVVLNVYTLFNHLIRVFYYFTNA